MPERIEVHAVYEVERDGFNQLVVEGLVDGQDWRHVQPVWMLDAHVAEWDLEDDDPADVFDMCLLLPFEKDTPTPFAEGDEKNRRRSDKRNRLHAARASGKLTYRPQARGAGHVAQVALDSLGRHGEIREIVQAQVQEQAKQEAGRRGGLQILRTPAEVGEHLEIGRGH